MQLDSLKSEFLLDIRIRNYTEKTIRGYKGNCERFLTFVQREYGTLKVEEVKATHIKQYAKYLQQRERSAVYTNTVLKNIRSMFKYAVHEGYIAKSPAERVNWCREEKTVLVLPTDKEIAKVLNVYNGKTMLDIRNATIMALFVDTGIRCSELIDLTPNSIINSTLIIDGKGNKQRYVPISPLLQKQLLKYMRARDSYYRDRILKSDKLFLSSRYKTLTVEAVERVVRKAGYVAEVNEQIRFSPHTLRHYYAVKMLDTGIDIYSLARLLGHNRIATTQRYVAATTDRQILARTQNNTPLSLL